MKKVNKLAFLDLDKTLYDGYIFFDWVKFLKEKGLVSGLQLLKLEEILAFYVTHISSYESTANNISQYFSEILDSKDISTVQKVTKVFLNEVKSRYYEHTLPLIKFLKDKGYKVVFVTNEPDFIAEDIKSQFGADDAIGLDIKIVGTKFKFGVTNDLFSKIGKEQVVKSYLKKTNLKKENAIAVGDSINDFGMLKAVGKGFLISHDTHLIDVANAAKIAICTKDNVLEKIETYVYSQE